MIQDLVGHVIPAFRATESWVNNVIGSALACAGWGYFLYQGVIDPFGGIQTLWPLFGVSNQMLAAMALILCSVIFFKMKRERFAWITLAPASWLVLCTVLGGLEKIASPDPKIGFLAHAAIFGDAAASGKLLAPAKSAADMGRIVFNDTVDATLAAVFVAIVLVMLVYGVRAALKALRSGKATTVEIGGAVAAAE